MRQRCTLKGGSILSWLLLFVINGVPTWALQTRVLSESLISSPHSGSHDWYDIEANPENPNSLIACGMKWNAQNNANYGYVYESQDGGRIWHTALEDRSSRWVSEESCAFGVRGLAYFVADASKTDGIGGVHHDQGKTRIWVSRDSGRTWVLGATTGWTDFSSSVVDQKPGPNQNRLYIFFNDVRLFYSSSGGGSALAKLSTKGNDSLGLISFKDGDGKIVGPVFDSEIYKQIYHSAYPSQNVIVKDGSLVTLFWTKRAVLDSNGKRTGREFVFSAQHTDPHRKSLTEPVIVQKSLVAPGQPKMKCNSYLSAPAAYDPTTNTVYAAYLDASSGRCSLVLERSTDDGQTWASSAWTEKPTSGEQGTRLSEHDFSGLALARREDGILALLWQDTDKPGTCLFAISTDDGKTYSAPQQISIGTDKDSGFHVTSESLAGC